MNSTAQSAIGELRGEFSLRRTATAWMRLLRPANLVTAATDILTGSVVVGHGGAPLPWLLCAGVALYGGGVVLNDFCDRYLDAVERPERPIPSGMISATSAAAAGLVLLAAGTAFAFRASLESGMVALAIAIFVLVYDFAAKHHHVVGPVVMGTCRGLNLLLGLTAAPALLGQVWYLGLLPLAYIGGITALSRGEVKGGTRRTALVALVLFLAVLMALVALGAGTWKLLNQLPFLILLALKVGPPLWQVCRIPSAAQIGAAVQAGVVGLIVLDSAIAAAYGGVLLGAAILALLVVATELASWFAVT